MATTQLRDQVKKQLDDVTDSAHQVFLAGLGVAALAEEEGSRLFDRLVARGRKVETAGRKRLEQGRKQALAARTRTEKTVEDVVERALGTVDGGLGRLAQRLGIPQQQQIQALTERVAELTRKIDSLQRAKTKTAAAR